MVYSHQAVSVHSIRKVQYPHGMCVEYTLCIPHYFIGLDSVIVHHLAVLFITQALITALSTCAVLYVYHVCIIPTVCLHTVVHQ